MRTNLEKIGKRMDNMFNTLSKQMNNLFDSDLFKSNVISIRKERVNDYDSLDFHFDDLGDKYEANFDVEGCKKKDIDIKICSSKFFKEKRIVVTIKKNIVEDNVSYSSKSIYEQTLPINVNILKITANVESNKLTITLPKEEEKEKD